MILPYFARLLCLCLAAFFLVHLLFSLLIMGTAPLAIRLAARIGSGSAARLLLAMRLFPSCAGILLVAGFCLPSYLWLEPEAAAEQVGLPCLAAASLAIVIWGISAARTLRATVRLQGFIRQCAHTGRQPAELSSVLVVETAAPYVALAGIMHPRLIISSHVIGALSADELAAAVRHERAHAASRDNLKRLLVLLTPGMVPFFRGFETLERAWATFTEWSADDRAVAGSASRSVSLAAALVRVARLGEPLPSCPLVTSLLPCAQDLSARVERLLRPAPRCHRPGRWIVPGAAIIAMALLIPQPRTLHLVHRLLEQLIR